MRRASTGSCMSPGHPELTDLQICLHNHITKDMLDGQP